MESWILGVSCKVNVNALTLQETWRIHEQIQDWIYFLYLHFIFSVKYELSIFT